MTLIREEVDCLFLKKGFFDTGTLLTLKHPAYVCGMSKGRDHMYVCRPTICCIHLCNFSKKKTNSQDDKVVSIGMEDQNLLKTQQLTKKL
jgi:hypothetical protein